MFYAPQFCHSIHLYKIYEWILNLTYVRICVDHAVIVCRKLFSRQHAYGHEAPTHLQPPLPRTIWSSPFTKKTRYSYYAFPLCCAHNIYYNILICILKCFNENQQEIELTHFNYISSIGLCVCKTRHWIIIIFGDVVCVCVCGFRCSPLGFSFKWLF